VRRRRLVRVPASSANLGPGFDVLAAALALHVEVEVVETGRFAVVTDLAIAKDRRNLVVRGFELLHAPDAFEFHIRSTIPLAGGLGSSAAAYVAGLMAADHLFELDADVLALATELEGHADNAAAALHGGFVICETQPEPHATRFAPPDGLEAVLVVPHAAVRTREARAVLPAAVPMADAVHNIAHVSQLVLGLATADWDLVSRGLADRLHEPHRAHLFPRSADILRRAPSFGALGATISGAGPTVLVWCHYDQTAGVFERLEQEVGDWAQVVRAPFEPLGADVRDLG
jgi:homoserine kinase